MRSVSIQQADLIYGCSESCEIKRQKVSSQPLSRLNESTFDLIRFVEQLDEDGYLERALQHLRNVRFALNSTPAAFADILASSGSYENFLHRTRNVAYQFPDAEGQVQSIVELLNQLKDEANPMLDALVQLSAEDNAAVLVKESRCVALAEKSLPNGIQVIVPQQLKTTRCFDSVLVYGITRWFPTHIFAAPRAKSMTLVHLDTLRDRWNPSPVFSATDNADTQPIYHGRIPYEIAEENTGSGAVDFDFAPLSEFQWARFAKAAVTQMGHEHDPVAARLFILENGCAVFLDADETSKSRVIDLDQSNSDEVRKLPVSQIRPGMFVVLRDGIGGDYVADIANGILGKDAQHSRYWQRRWKVLLREKVDAVGSAQAVVSLVRLGCKIANEPNLRNWMSFANIKPRDLDHFEAILSFIGLLEQRDAVWEILVNIDRAHKAAGRQISNQLTELLNKCDHWKLQRDGYMEVRFRENDCSQLCAIRVVDVQQEQTVVDYSAIGQIIRDTELLDGTDDPSDSGQ